ncbi:MULTISPECIES: ACT domain-containing protein [unclassified Actinobaculum]|uniref:ACT domain-containing protein n=1 Tax=unclassified Actinobaculum TaxID=2609299 RepID=UPI000D52604D|nr:MULTISPECIES: ACT domain-containing protein [unclassified Actinobaculum]AWE42664.1 ACT domain-containing protein [Actinobaculum sp. 313]RTE49472.1 ACT domain-containing protein [Actinobaculum sp. 352]
MRGIMTVTGLDHTGIIAAVSTALAEQNANITNVSQTLMGDYFTMILQVDFDETQTPLAQLQELMAQVGEAQGLEIRIQSEAIFNAMHRL